MAQAQLVAPRGEHRRVNWLRARNDYVRSELQLTAADIAHRNGTTERAVRNHMQAERWGELRTAYIDSLVTVGDARSVERRVEEEGKVRRYWSEVWSEVGEFCADQLRRIKASANENGGVMDHQHGPMVAHLVTALERAWRGNLGSLGIRPDSRDRGQGLEGMTLVVRMSDGTIKGEDGRRYIAVGEDGRPAEPAQLAAAVQVRFADADADPAAPSGENQPEP